MVVIAPHRWWFSWSLTQLKTLWIGGRLLDLIQSFPAPSGTCGSFSIATLGLSSWGLRTVIDSSLVPSPGHISTIWLYLGLVKKSYQIVEWWFLSSDSCRQSLWTDKAWSLDAWPLLRSGGGLLDQAGQGGDHGGRDGDGDHDHHHHGDPEVCLLRSGGGLLDQGGQLRYWLPLLDGLGFHADMMITKLIQRHNMIMIVNRLLIFPEGTTTDGTALIRFQYFFIHFHQFSTTIFHFNIHSLAAVDPQGWSFHPREASPAGG